MSAATDAVRAAVRRTKSYPLSERQACVLAYCRLQVAGGNPFPTLRQIAAFLEYEHGHSDLQEVLLALAAKGLLRSTARVPNKRSLMAGGWVITDEGWAE